MSDGVRYAADNGARVINMSLGGTSQSTLVRDALAYAVSRGVSWRCRRQ
jgi:serine protease